MPMRSAAHFTGTSSHLSHSEALSQLGLKPEACATDITHAFRHLAKKAHPDLNGGTDEALRRLILARDILMAQPHMRAVKTDPAPEVDRPILHISPRMALFGGDHAFSHDGVSLKAKLPAGLRDGDPIRLNIHDTAGRSREVFQVEIDSDETLRIAGNDVWTSASVDRDVLYFGGTDRIDTPHGFMDIQVLQAFERGSCLCLKGYGLPATDIHPAGDLFVRLEARPRPLRPAAELHKAFLRRWA